MQGVGYPAHFGIVPLAPHTGIHIQGNPRPAAYLIRHADGFLHRFCGETVAVFPAALAPEFLTGKVPDIVPECSRFRRVAALRLLHIYRRPGNGTNQHFLGSRTRYPVHSKPVVGLKRPDCPLGIPALNAVNRAGRIAQIGQEALDLLYRHTFTSSQPLGYAEGDHTLFPIVERYTLPPSVQQSPLL